MGYFVKQSGAITYNVSTNEMEYNNGTATVVVAKTGAVDPVTDTIVIGTGGTGAGPYTMSVDYGSGGDYDFDPDNPEYITVYVEGIYQEPGAGNAYTVTNNTITFESVPADGLTVTVIHGTRSTDVPNTNVF